MADSVNHLLVVGFYLINIGYVSLALKYGDKPRTSQDAFEFLSTKIGLVLLILGGMHFFNVFNFVNYNALSGLSGGAGSINGTVGGYDPNTHDAVRVGTGSGVFAAGAPRQTEFGLRLEF